MNRDLKKILSGVEKPGRYVGGEFGGVMKDPSVPVRVAFCFPDTYEIGMSNLGMKILTGVLNRLDFCWCERAFCPWPDMADEMRKNGVKLGTLESGDSLADFDIVAFTLQYEMCYTDVLEMLDLAGIPLRSCDRGENDPIVIAGGPCAYNAEPMADFIDLFSIGEGEEMIPELITLYRDMKGAGKAEFLRRAACEIGGAYVPSLYTVEYDSEGRISAFTPEEGIPATVTKRIVADLDSAYFPTDAPVASGEVVQDRDSIELFRGCVRGCRFCQAGHTFRPIRQKRPETLANQAFACLAHSGAGELVLSSLSTSDYSALPELCDLLLPRLEKEKINLSVPSLRADNFSTELTKRIAGVRKSSITFAPEAGSQRLRDVINKNLSQEDLLEACRVLFESGWSRVKLYFMLGLPTETPEDIEGIAEMADSVVHLWRTCDRDRSQTKQLAIALSTSLFIPKPFTPFQWERMCTPDEMYAKIAVLKNKLKARAVSYAYHDPHTSMMEGIFARGDRRLGAVVYAAWKKGCRFDSWEEYFKYDTWIECIKEAGLDPFFYLRERGEDEILPWSHIDCGVTVAYLKRSRKDAYREVITPDCRNAPGGCSGCGANRLLGGKCQLSLETEDKPLPAYTAPEVKKGEPVSVRLRFEKFDKGVYTSHLELMKTFAMAFKRAGVPLKHSEGFNPKPYISLARPLSLGYESRCEILDTSILDFDGDVAGLIQKTNQYLPIGIRITGNAADVKVADIFASGYTVVCETKDAADDAMAEAVKALLSGPLTVEKRSKKGMKTVDVSQQIFSLDVAAENGMLVIRAVLKDAADGSLNPRYLVSAVNEKLPGVDIVWADYCREAFYTEAEARSL
ncbi:MAG: TIGR03960 family B12-binding radical SAM protein [Clostridia bacterium]|nr:TIGR03960 family B12-binding radical SAM protein [Clostridia bacterium]